GLDDRAARAAAGGRAARAAGAGSRIAGRRHRLAARLAVADALESDAHTARGAALRVREAFELTSVLGLEVGARSGEVDHRPDRLEEADAPVLRAVSRRAGGAIPIVLVAQRRAGCSVDI